MASIFDTANRTYKPPPALIAPKPAAAAPAAAMPTDAEFAANFNATMPVNRPPPRATSPDGLTYLDTGERTPLYYHRQENARGTPGYENIYDPTFVPTRDQLASGEYKMDKASGTYYTTASNGIDRLHVTNNPAEDGGSPAFTVGKTPDGLRVSPGDGTIPGRQATPEEANRANANYIATGNSTPQGGWGAPGSGVGGVGELGTLAQNARDQFGAIAGARHDQARDMYAQGAAAQGRSAAQTSAVNYGAAQKVGSSNAAAGNYGAEQRIQAPTLAAARQAATGDFGAQQSVSAQQVGPAAQAQAQQATNQAGFLGGTAAGARGIADLDYAQADQSRGDIQQSLGDIRGFLSQGPGPSMAQQQLRMAQEQNLGDALSLARSGRGNAAGNMKMALSENAATNAQTNMQSALLRAQEADTWQGRQLQGLGLQSSTATNLRGQDLSAAQAQGQHAVSREQIASNVDVSRAGLEQQLAMNNAELGTRANLQNAAETNTGNRLNAQLGTEAALQEASLANARNIALGQAGTNVNLQNAEQQNLNSRLQGQLASDAAIQQAGLANQRNIAMGDAGTNVSVSNANNASAAERARAELANSLAIASGNSRTQINTANLEAQMRQREANDRLLSEMTGYGVDLGNQELNAANYGVGADYNYADLAAEIDWRNLDRAAGVKSEERARKDKKDAAAIQALATFTEAVL